MTTPHRRADGWVVRASVLARLFGIRLLRLDADLVLVPAGDIGLPDGHGGPYRTVPVTVASPYRAVTATTGSLEDAARLVAHATRTLDRGG